ncbi:MAG: hypothetical protein EOO08_10295 [Chitinophagaceae bacterium]|nr:MAG: hypothetical protein EOO08_10295 [Chitinophagaceae bacterium]
MIRSLHTIILFFAIAALIFSCARQPLPPPPPDHSSNEGRVGAAARDLLTDSVYQSVLIEIQYMEGFAPDSMAVRNTVHFIERYSHKPGGVRVVLQQIPTVRDTIYSVDELLTLERKYRAHYNDEDELALYLLYTNGVFVEASSLGYAYGATSAVIFGKNVLENSDALRRPSRTNLETKVLQHEVAHLMGLVNVGTPLQSDHKDNEHGKHCINKQCLMYYTTDIEESPSLVVRRKPVPVLDAACLADLRANGGR